LFNSFTAGAVVLALSFQAGVELVACALWCAQKQWKQRTLMRLFALGGISFHRFGDGTPNERVHATAVVFLRMGFDDLALPFGNS
jgi:hypothetical protein